MLTWLSREIKGYQRVRFIFTAILVDVVYSLLMMHFLDKWGWLEHIDAKTVIYSWPFNKEHELALLLVFTELSFIEEVIFRLLPLGGFIYLCGVTWKVVGVALFSSVLFGYWHGGYASILIQGVSGMIYALVFLKCGGLQKKYFEGLLSSWACHAGANISFILIQVVLRWF